MFLFNIAFHNLFMALVIMLCMVGMLILVVILYSFREYNKYKNHSRWRILADQKISEAIVYGESESQESASEFDQAIQFSKFRFFFLERLVESEKKFSGMAHQEIKKLFEEYKLEKEALWKLEQSKNHLIAGGIQELTSMQVIASLPKIETFLNHPEALVYQEAQYAIVKFKGFEGLSFLSSTQQYISDWQQLRLLMSISKIPESDNEIVLEWLSSENTTVVIFTLSLLRKFQMLRFYPNVWELINHPSEFVKVRVVQTLQALENDDTISNLIEVFPNQSLDVQKEIIKAIGNSGEKKAISFVLNQLQIHDDIELRILAAQTLLVLGYRIELLKIIEIEPESILSSIIKHALQEKV